MKKKTRVGFRLQLASLLGLLCPILLSCLFFAVPAAAMEQDNYDLREMDEELNRLFPKQKMEFDSILSHIMKGDMQYLGEMVRDYVEDQISYVFLNCKRNLIIMVALALIGAMLGNFSSIFNNEQIADVSFYMVYMLIFAFSLSSFQVMADWIESGVEGLADFMSVFCPIFFISLTTAKGSVTALAFNNMTLFILLLTEKVILKVVLPMIRIYFIARMLNYLMKEAYLSKLAELIKMVLGWMMKTILAVIIGMNAVQCLISPAIDTVKRSALTRGAESIPGVGNAIGGAAEVAIGTAMLVKNGIGMTGALISALICVGPMIQIGIIVLLYKLAVAAIQPVCEKRVIGCVDSVSEGGILLMRMVFVTAILFLLTIVMISASAGEL